MGLRYGRHSVPLPASAGIDEPKCASAAKAYEHMRIGKTANASSIERECRRLVGKLDVPAADPAQNVARIRARHLKALKLQRHLALSGQRESVDDKRSVRRGDLEPAAEIDIDVDRILFQRVGATERRAVKLGRGRDRRANRGSRILGGLAAGAENQAPAEADDEPGADPGQGVFAEAHCATPTVWIVGTWPVQRTSRTAALLGLYGRILHGNRCGRPSTLALFLCRSVRFSGPEGFVPHT